MIQDRVVLAIGFLGQALFGARMMIQWIQSEREQKVVSSQLFWKSSLIASALLLLYGVFRHDAVIVVGQLVSYFIYIRNLQLMDEWKQFTRMVRVIFISIPFLVLSIAIPHNAFSLGFFLQRNAITHWWMMAGWAGQALLNVRFIYQLYFAERAHQSILPLGFWIISLAGSAMLMMYAFFRLDLVLIAGQLFGIFIYSRNILIDREAYKIRHNETTR